MDPDHTTIGRFWHHDETNRLWLQEYADRVIVSFVDGFYAPLHGKYERPERLLVVSGTTDHGLRLLAEPIIETLQREQEEKAA